MAVSVCGRFGLWPFRSVAISVCGRFGLWPFRSVAVSVCGRSVFGRSGLWPFRFVAVSVCGRLGFGRLGLWPLWPESVIWHPFLINNAKHFPGQLSHEGRETLGLFLLWWRFLTSMLFGLIFADNSYCSPQNQNKGLIIRQPKITIPQENYFSQDRPHTAVIYYVS